MKMVAGGGRRSPHIVVATPGRLLDLIDAGALSLGRWLYFIPLMIYQYKERPVMNVHIASFHSFRMFLLIEKRFVTMQLGCGTDGLFLFLNFSLPAEEQSSR